MSEYIYEHVPSGVDATDNSVEVQILEQREEIVRCRDCKYMFDWAYDRMLCKMWADGGMDDDTKNVLYPTVKPDGFCSRGELRGDAE